MSKITLLLALVGLIGFSSCKKCKYCTTYTNGIEQGTAEYCGEELKYKDGDYDSVTRNGFLCH